MKMKQVFALIFLLVVGCGGDLVQDSYEVVTPTLPPTATSVPTSAPLTRADGIALAFYREWNNRNYEAMYALLAAETRSFVEQEQFVGLYEEAMDTVRVVEVMGQPLSSFQEGDSAEMLMRVIWETAVVGTIVREHDMRLRYENGQWAILWNEGLIMPELLSGNRLKLNIQTPERAILYDRGETQLSFQGSGVVLEVVPQDIVDEAGFVQAVGFVLELTADEVRAKYAELPENWSIPLGVVSTTTIEENFYALEPYFEAGLNTSPETGRMYTPDGIAPHLIGYMGYITPEQSEAYWQRGYRGDERIGITGLEGSAEKYLAGTRGGTLKLLNPAGEEIDIIAEIETIPGRAVHTTFDSAFQLAVQQALAEAIETHPLGHAGAIVVLDVNTGAVRAMASYPTYDASVFSEVNVDSGDEIGRLLNDATRPLVNRATQSGYPAGSTFKIVTTSAGIDSQLYGLDTPYYCTGSWLGLGEANIKYDWLLSGHGSVTPVQLLTRSCNTYSYEIGFALDKVDPFLLPNMARLYGLGQVTGIEVDESAGLIPDPEWKIANLGDGWSPGDAVNLSIGQGFMLATPLQIANMTAAVANGGTLYQPTLIERIEGNRSVPEEVPPPIVLSELPLSAEILVAVKVGLGDVTSGSWGTAVDRMAGLEITTAGKTGTAQVAGEDIEPHAWFTGFAPYETPEIAITVIIENAGQGSDVAAPIFRRVVELYYGLEITPLPWP